MSTPKLQRFKENTELDNVLEFTEFEGAAAPDKPAGRWCCIFGNANPLVLELACGRGEYALNLAQRFPDKNFIGVDIKGARIWKGAKRADRESISNARFLRIYIEHIDQYFEKGEVSEIWITFPDPFLKRRQAGKRLTSARFIDLYNRVLADDGPVNLKTDSAELYHYTLGILNEKNCRLLRSVQDVYRDTPDDPLLTIRTAFEESHLQQGKTISYIKFRLPVQDV